jgi:hypothetical protein
MKKWQLEAKKAAVRRSPGVKGIVYLRISKEQMARAAKFR